MARASYRAGIEWIALNDEPAETDHDTVKDMISVSLLSHLFEKDADEVAKAVIRFRARHDDL
jgi:hypothetical protein